MRLPLEFAEIANPTKLVEDALFPKHSQSLVSRIGGCSIYAML